MAFLFQDQNQGTRNETAPRTCARPFATVLFHPDFNRRLRNHTESADPNSWGDIPKKKALPGLGFVTLTAGGELHPALRTSAARNGRPDSKYDQTPAPGQAASAWGNSMSPCRGNRA